MAGIVGSTGPLVGVSSIAIPTGAAVKQLCILWDDLRSGTSGRPGDDWNTVGHKSWSHRLTQDDLNAGSFPVRGTNAFLIVLSSAGGIDRVRDSKYARCQAGGVAVWLGWMSPYHSSALASATYQRGSTILDPVDQYRHGAWARAVTTAGDYEPGSVSSHTDIYAISVLPVGVPGQPTWLTTSGQPVDRTQPIPLSFVHQSSAELAMDRCRVEIRVAGGTWQHLAADGTLVATAQELVRSEPRVLIAAGQLAVNTTYEARAYTHDDGGWSVASGTLTLIARTPPTLVATLATALGDLSPTASWVVTPGLGAQRSWEVAMAAQGQPPEAALSGWASGAHAGSETSWQAAASGLAVNGGSYVAWVRVRDDALSSAWTASPAQVVSWTAPAAPASVMMSDTRPLTATASGVPPVSLALEWQREVSAGVWPDTVIVTDGPLATETIEMPDAPYGVALRVRVRAIAAVDGVRLASAWVTSDPLASTDTDAYLISNDGREWLRVRIVSDAARTLRQGITVLGGYRTGGHPRTMRTVPAGEEGQTVLSVWSDDELTDLVKWLSLRDGWWMRWPPEIGPDGMRDKPTMHMAMKAQVGWERKVQFAVQTRQALMDWVQTAA